MKKSILAITLFSVLILLVSCSKPGEVTVSKYFQAMVHNDKDTMAAMAVEPKDLEYKSYKVTAASELEKKTFEFPVLTEAKKALEKEKEEQGTKALDAKYALEDLNDAMGETRRGSRKGEVQQQIKDAEAAYKAEEDKYKKVVTNLNDTKKKLGLELEMIKMCTGIDQEIDLYEGETYIQKVDVKVTLLNGQEKDYVFLLRQTNLKLQDKVYRGRLIILKILTAEEFAAGN